MTLCLGFACREEVTQVSRDVLNSTNRTEASFSTKTKLDFLFVIDDSGSMCEEQENLTRDFRLISDFIFTELRGKLDYRIAVVSTDIGYGDQDNDSAGRFLYRPASPDAFNCLTDDPPATIDCGAPGSAPPIISSEDIEQSVDQSLPQRERILALRAELERQFRCRATLGTQGAIYEKGLEAMRLSLSCRGPNSDMFAGCCVNLGQPNAYYDPECQLPSGQPEPAFLRPDAGLVVVLISDEDDCSTPLDAPKETSRLICRPGGQLDTDDDGVPDIYQERCQEGVSPAECYVRECGEYVNDGPSRCREERCDLYYTDGIECQWHRDRLTPVSEYREFLQSLKARPRDQLLVTTLVGFRTYTELGNELQYSIGPSIAGCQGDDFEHTERCCPEGDCRGRVVQSSCDVAERGILAFPGTRYLELSEALGDNGLGCPAGKEPIVDPVDGALMSAPGVDPSECLNICVDDFSAPLQAMKKRASSLLNTYCTERTPACVVPASTDEMGQLIPQRLCEGDEVSDPKNYNIQVSVRCTSETCDEPQPLTSLSADEWSLNLHSGGGACVVFNSAPPVGSEVILTFLTNTDEP